MLKMAVISWIVCVLVVSSAIPFVKKGEVTQTYDRNELLAEENNELEIEKSSNEKRSGEDPATINKTDHHQAVPESEVRAFINRLDNTTNRLHIRMREMYRWYTNDNTIKHDTNVVSAVRDNLIKNFPDLYLSNKTFHSSKVVTLNRKPPKAEITNHTNKSDIQILNSTASQAYSQKKQTQKIPKENKKELKHNNGRELAQITDKTVPQLNDDVTQATPAEHDIHEAPVTSCQHVPEFYEPRFLEMVVNCSTHWTKLDIKTQCEYWQNLNTFNFMDEMTFLPVQDENGTVYANVYCAMCHDVTFFLPWTTSIVCSKASPESFQTLDFTNPTPLYLHLTSSDCERQIFPSIPEALIECEKATFGAFDNARKGITDETGGMSSNYPISFNVLMNFDFTGKTHILFTASQTIVEEEYIPRCQDGQIYDPYTENCRQITCNRFYTLVGNKCVRDSSGYISSDGITNLSQLRTVNVVTLQVNITFRDFLIMKLKDTEPDIVPQISNCLNISVDRLQDVNITYEFGSINGSILQVTTLTDDEFKNILLFNHSLNLARNWSHDWKEVWRTEGDAGEWPSKLPEVASTNADSSSDNMAQSTTYDTLETVMFTQDETNVNKVKPVSRKLKLQLTTPHANSITNKRNGHTLKPGEEPTYLPPAPSAGNAKKPHIPRYNTASMDEQRTHVTGHDLILNKKLFSYHGLLVSTHYDSFFRYHFKSENDNADLYISGPINDQNDRIFLLIRSSMSFDQLLQQNMVMRISFALVSPNDPLSNEAGSMTLLQKIDNLIFEQRFSLVLNGNEVDVVAVDDDRNKTNDEVEFCSWGVEYIVYDDEFMILTVGNLTFLYVNKTNSYISVGLFDLFIIVSGSNNAEQTNVTGMIRYAFVCFMPRIIEDCNRIDLEKKEYHFAGANKSIIFEGKEYDIFQYRVLDENTGSVQICVPPTFNNHDDAILPHFVTVNTGCSSDFDRALRAEGYMTLILGRVSIFAVCCVILTYIILPTLRNLPGLNLLSLTFCLLVTQVIFAEGIGEDRHWLCKTVAVSLHYTLLAAHFWMNVISYDVYKTFTSSTTMTHGRQRPRCFLRYALYAWGMPFIIVSICVFVDFSNLFDGVSIGYGSAPASSTADVSYPNLTVIAQDDMDNSNKTFVTDHETIHSCWITQPLAALVAFGSIIMIIFLVNCIFFVKTIMSISKTAKIARENLSTRYSNSSSHKMADHSEVMLYVRMSTVMGFTWVFGLSSSILSSFVKPPTYTACAVIHMVVILFIILNTSQGFFIFVAFVCNRRVFGLYKDCTLRVLKTRKNIRPFTTISSKRVLSPQNS